MHEKFKQFKNNYVVKSTIEDVTKGMVLGGFINIEQIVNTIDSTLNVIEPNHKIDHKQLEYLVLEAMAKAMKN